MGSRILVIDDETVVLGAVRKALGRMDYTVDTMDTAREALKLLDNTTYDLVITDLMMPDIDGLEFMRQLHDMKATTQVIMLTGYPTIQSALQAKRFGAFEYVTKPFTRQELLSVVVRALRLGNLKAGEQESSLQAPGNLYLLPEHSWARVEHEGTVQIGMARAFAVGVARVAGLELPVLNANLEQGRVCVIVRAEDAVEHQLHSPLSGRVVEVNPAVLESPELAANDPESAGWLLRLIPTDLDKELHNLVPR